MKSMEEIETSRLRLRAHKVEDFKGCYEMWADPQVYKNISGQASSRQQTWMRILNYSGHWKLMGFGYWAIELKSNGHYIGELGFADFKREMSPSIEGLPEMGWALKSEYHGQGFAKEALQKALQWGLQNLKSDKIACIINPNNAVSINLATHLGFQFSQSAMYAGQPVQLYFKSNC